LLALAAWRSAHTCSAQSQRRIDAAARAGLVWLLDLQNSDGGWPTFCRGWGKLPFDRSGPDLTAHALRAVAAWRLLHPEVQSRCDEALARGLAYLERSQQPNGSWFPLWFGNQDHPQEENPVYGTARVLLAYRDLGLSAHTPAQRGCEWLVSHQNADGSWGGPAMSSPDDRQLTGSVEETALAVESLSAFPVVDDESFARGVRWLVEAVEADKHREPAPIGFYFSKLWYYEKLYPVIFSVSALGQALKYRASLPAPTSVSADMAC
jgi:squalene-hopene/tetraprenyl-beta-curcumene cyclase